MLGGQARKFRVRFPQEAKMFINTNIYKYYIVLYIYLSIYQVIYFHL